MFQRLSYAGNLRKYRRPTFGRESREASDRWYHWHDHRYWKV